MLDTKVYASFRLSLIVFLACLLVGWLLVTQPGIGVPLVLLALLAALLALAIGAFARTRQSFDRYPRSARLTYFTLLFALIAVGLTFLSAYRYTDQEGLPCGGFPLNFACSSITSYHRSAVDFGDILLGTGNMSFWLNVAFYLALLAPLYFAIVVSVPRDEDHAA